MEFERLTGIDGTVAEMARQFELDSAEDPQDAVGQCQSKSA